MGRSSGDAVRVALLLAALVVGRTQAAEPPPAEDLLTRAKAVLSQLDGEFSLPGLRNSVQVVRDRWGVPHIYAADTHDLFYAQGVVAAQDRLFQIDLWRRTAVGELAEAMGPEAIDRDRLARLVRYRGDWEAEWNGYGPHAREIATAFTAGINDYIDLVQDRLPIEFQLAGYRPGKWKPEDVVGRMAGIVMVRNLTAELARAELIGAVGLEKAEQLLPLDPAKTFEWPAALDSQGITRDVLGLHKKGTEKIRFSPPLTKQGAVRFLGDGDGGAAEQGSNNWVVAGSRTGSGKPILANDPHRPLGLPSLRYLVHLNAPGWNVIGAGEPALPGVAVGHNDEIAWGLTIVGTDQADLYVEEIHPEDVNRYRVGDEWHQMRIEKEAVRVAGRDEPMIVELRFTKHGPVIHEDRERRRAFALRWVGAEPGTAGYMGSLALNQARNWDEFLQAAELWRLPSENLIYADRRGNIGWIAAALTPLRGAGLGVIPVPGADSKFNWRGFLPTNSLPQEFNPARGFIATANANILPPDYPHHLAVEWAQPFRQERVREVLAQQRRHTIEDSKRLQHDNVSLAAKTLVRLAERLPNDDGELRPFIELIRSWDGDLSAESRAGPLYGYWLAALQEEFAASYVPKPQADIVRPGVWTMLQALETPDQRWFPGESRAACDQLLRRTFVAAVAKTKKALGDEIAGWAWGKLHTARFTHPLSSLNPQYAAVLDLGPVPRPGDGLTPNATTHDEKFAQTNGASYRQIFDLADWDRGWATSTPGQSGQPGSPYYADLLPLWERGEYFPLKFSRAAVEEAAAHRLTLRPR